MAAGKENEAPAAAVAAQRHALAVRRCGPKKRGLCRVPLRDITNLVAATELELLPVQVTKLDAVVSPPTVVQDAVAAGVAGKAARYSLRKQFR
jgi:hypothetical protein